MQILRKTIAIFLVLNTLGTALAVPLIYLDFSLRRDYISKVLCIKKDKPITICGGKCYLVTQLKKVTSEEKKTRKPTIPSAEISLFFENTSSVLTSLRPVELENTNGYTLTIIPIPALSLESPPPQFV